MHPNAQGNYWIFYQHINKKASTVLRFCCKALRKRQSTQEEHLRSTRRKHSTACVFPYTSVVLYRSLRALQQNSTV